MREGSVFEPARWRSGSTNTDIFWSKCKYISLLFGAMMYKVLMIIIQIIFRANVWEIEPFQPNFCRKIKYIWYTRLAKNAFKGSKTYIWKTDRVLNFSFFDVRFTFKCQKLHFITEYIIHSKWVQIKLNYGIIKCKNNQLTLVYP